MQVKEILKSWHFVELEKMHLSQKEKEMKQDDCCTGVNCHPDLRYFPKC